MNRKLAKQVGLRVRKARKNLGLSQRQLAEELQISNAFLCEIEKGKRQPSLHRLIQLAQALGVQPGHLLPHSENL